MNIFKNLFGGKETEEVKENINETPASVEDVAEQAPVIDELAKKNFG